MGKKNGRGKRGRGGGMAKGRIPRIGSYAISSSITDPTCFSCTTFNILAPIYKRLDLEVYVFSIFKTPFCFSIYYVY